jgi:hypothetical protein
MTLTGGYVSIREAAPLITKKDGTFELKNVPENLIQFLLWSRIPAKKQSGRTEWQ